MKATSNTKITDLQESNLGLWRLWWVAWIALFAMACAPVQDSPFSADLSNGVQALNAPFLSDGQSKAQSFGSVRFAFISDTHSHYNKFENIIDELNQQRDLDFVIHGGDFTDHGLAFEFETYIGLLNRLRLPSFTVIGNHDTVSSGKRIYRETFGSFNATRVISGYKFIFWNSNRLDFYSEGLDYDWLERELASSEGLLGTVFVSHVPIWANDYFEQAQRDYLSDLLKEHNTLIALHGHQNPLLNSRYAGLRYHGVSDTRNEFYLVIEIENGEVLVNRCQTRRACEVEF